MYLNSDQMLASYLPSIMRNAAYDVQKATQAPMPMIVSSMLAVAAGVSQRWVNVSFRDGSPHGSPVSLYLMPIAESGERKSMVDAIVTAPLSVADEAQTSLSADTDATFKVAKAVWDTTRNALERSLRNAVQSGLSIDECKRALIDHLTDEPMKQGAERFLFQHVSVSSLSKVLSQKTTSALQLSTEASALLDKSDAQSFSFFSQLWDGATIHFERYNAIPIRISNVRFSTCMMIQPIMLEKFIKKQGHAARGSGNLGRFLVSFPDSTQGGRFVEDRSIPSSTLGLNLFHQRIEELMNLDYSDSTKKKFTRNVLHLDQDAKHMFLNFYNSIEAELAQGRYLSDVRDMGSKASENVARIAAVIHFFEGKNGPIDGYSMQTAVQLGSYFVNQFKMLFGFGGRFSNQYAAKAILEKWFITQYHEGNWRISRRSITNFGPSILRRDPVMLESVLTQLHLERKIIRVMNKKSVEICLNADFFNQTPPTPMLRIAD